jgi:hypothetical protein
MEHRNTRAAKSFRLPRRSGCGSDVRLLTQGLKFRGSTSCFQVREWKKGIFRPTPMGFFVSKRHARRCRGVRICALFDFPYTRDSGTRLDHCTTRLKVLVKWGPVRIKQCHRPLRNDTSTPPISWLSVALAFIVSGTGVTVSCPSQSGAS